MTGPACYEAPVCWAEDDMRALVEEPVCRVGSTPIVSVFTTDIVPEKKETMRELLFRIVDGTVKDFMLTNRAGGGKAAKFGAGLVVGGKVATEFGAVTPLKWMLRGFGPLPGEFTASGAIQVFNYTTLQRALIVGKAAAAKFVLVTVAFEGGVLVGSVVNQFLSDQSKMAIGGTLNEIINEGGWKLLFRHPFGIGM